MRVGPRMTPPHMYPSVPCCMVTSACHGYVDVDTALPPTIRGVTVMAPAALGATASTARATARMGNRRQDIESPSAEPAPNLRGAVRLRRGNGMTLTMSENLAAILTDTAERAPRRVAIKLDDAELNYALLDEASARVAGAARPKGVEPGDRVGIMLPNVPYFPVVYYGILRAGGVVVPMNVLLKGREVGVLPRGLRGPRSSSPGTSSPRPRGRRRGGGRRAHRVAAGRVRGAARRRRARPPRWPSATTTTPR